MHFIRAPIQPYLPDHACSLVICPGFWPIYLLKPLLFPSSKCQPLICLCRVCTFYSYLKSMRCYLIRGFRTLKERAFQNQNYSNYLTFRLNIILIICNIPVYVHRQPHTAKEHIVSTLGLFRSLCVMQCVPLSVVPVVPCACIEVFHLSINVGGESPGQLGEGLG